MSMLTLTPLIAFLAMAMYIGWRARHQDASGKGGFLSDYYIGNRTLGGFVLAMTTVATYGSVSSFVGGPGQAWNVGFGWLYMSAVQVTALFLLFGILGKKMALVSRKIDAVTVIDVLRARFESNALAVASALIMVIFFISTMVAQFVGAANLFQAVTGYSYTWGLVIFGIAVILFTTIGGFRGVAFTDTLCGIVMLAGIVILGWAILNAGGGLTNIMDTIREQDPAMLTPTDDGGMPLGLYFTQWLLVGVFTFALPQSMVRTMGFRDTHAMKSAMVSGTVILGAMMIGVTALGVLSRGVLTEPLSAYGTVDNVIPAVIVETMPPWLAGFEIIGPIAASISTVSSLLIAASSALIKDLWIHRCQTRGKSVGERSVERSSQLVTLVIGVIVFMCAVTPPSVIWRINMFAFGGLETAFCWVMVMGLFWRRANATGALASLVVGDLVYCVCMAIGFRPFGLHQIVIGITVSLLCMVVGSLLGKPSSKAAMDVFFPQESKSVQQSGKNAR